MPRPRSRAVIAAQVLVTVLLPALAVAGCGRTSASTAESTAAAGSASSSGGNTSVAASPAPSAMSYVALGDSYAAAPGVPTTSVAGGCFRSDHDYPHLLAAALHARLTDVTCSGATTDDLTGRQRILQVSVPPQLDALSRSTALVTLGMGGNDLGLFQAVLDRCLRGDASCLDGIGIERDTTVVEHRIEGALRRIHRRSPEARVVLVGYPQLIPADRHGCAALPANSDVLARVGRLIADFSTMMARAAAARGATYVDLIGPSAGHDICSGSPWINGPRNTDQAMAFHPLLAEQQAVAGLVARAVG